MTPHPSHCTFNQRQKAAIKPETLPTCYLHQSGNLVHQAPPSRRRRSSDLIEILYSSPSSSSHTLYLSKHTHQVSVPRTGWPRKSCCSSSLKQFFPHTNALWRHILVYIHSGLRAWQHEMLIVPSWHGTECSHRLHLICPPPPPPLTISHLLLLPLLHLSLLSLSSLDYMMNQMFALQLRKIHF